MPLLVLPPRMPPNSLTIERAARDAGWETARLSGYGVPPWLSGRNDLAFYGEPQFVLEVAPQLGVRMLATPPAWLARVPQRFLRRNVRLATMGEARLLSQPAFVKPAVDKSFKSSVIASAAELPPPSRVPDATAVLIAEPVEWTVEYRAFVLDRRIMTSSIYLRQGRLASDPENRWPAPPEEAAEARAFLESVLADAEFRIPAAVVVDAGTIRDRGWAVVEANAAWSSGLYGCDPSAVLPVLARACVRPARAEAGDADWLAE